MTMAELFIQIGVKGADTAGKALGGVKSGLGDIKDMSLEAKAAILGAIYALERMMSSSAKSGTELLDFSTATGLSAQSLQKWQWAAQQANNSAEDVSGSVKTLQDNMLKMLQGGGAPSSWAAFEQFMNATGETLTGEKIRNMDYMFHAIQKFAQAGPADVMREKVAALIGGSDKMFAAFRMNAFRPEVENKAPAYSDNQIGHLNKANIAWANLGTKVKMAFGDFTAKHGEKLVADITMITDKVIKLAEVLMKIAERFKIFEAVSGMFTAMGSVLDKVASFGKTAEGSDSNFFKMINSTEWKETKKHFKNWMGEKSQPGPGASGDRNWAAPDLKSVPKEKTEINIEQNLNFQHDGKDAHKNADSHRKAAFNVYRQLPALAEV